MIDEKHIDLIHRDAEGATTSDESQALGELYRMHPEAQALRQELTQLFRMLEEEREFDPPARLEKDIYRAVRSLRQRQGPQRHGPIAFVAEIVTDLVGRVRLRSSYAFALGLSLGILIVAALPEKDPSFDRSRLSGTLLRESSERFVPADLIQFRTDDVTGSVAARQSDESVLVDLEFEARDVTEVVVEFEPAVLGAISFARDEPTDGTAAFDTNTFRVSGSKKARYQLRLSRKTEEESLLKVRILTGETVLEKELRLAQGENVSKRAADAANISGEAM